MFNDFKTMIPELVPMFNLFEEIDYKNKKLSTYTYYVMGQICIDKPYRGKGIFKDLYLKHKEFYSDKFELCLTEVSTRNIPSMKAHTKIGFEVINVYKDHIDEWNVLAWDWR
jgi:GNAT superfamily N-acetyltransferase